MEIIRQNWWPKGEIVKKTRVTLLEEKINSNQTQNNNNNINPKIWHGDVKMVQLHNVI